MPIFIGGTEIKDIKIGSTDINSVWIGATKVWERLNVTMSPPTGNDSDLKISPQNAVAQVDLTATTSVSWSFSVVSSNINFGGTLSYGATSGTSTYVRLVQSQVGFSDAVVNVTATLGATSVTKTVTVEAYKETLE